MPPITVPLHLPELAPGAWLQGPAVSLGFARGAVVLVDFWEATCVNCLRTLPYVVEWHRRYAARGLVVVGVHTPEFELTRDPEVVAAVVREQGIRYPVLLDVERETWRRFANRAWPAKHLADARGYLRYEHDGEGAYGEIERWIQKLLREAGDQGAYPEPLAPLRPEDAPGAVCRPATRELYLGYHRGRLLAPEGYRPEEEVRHAGRPEPAPEGMCAARGLWFHAAEYLEAREAGAELELVCEAAGVQAVAAPAGELEVEMDGAPVPAAWRGADVVERGGRTVAVWERPGLVGLLAGAPFARRRLLVRALGPGVRLYTFTFTSCVAPAE
ncbi:MAG TPA: redoxin domain-containing protein [Thermoanaerobaculia bacterium]|nr:redoxin domain-containing protein [Thermoanaerobaculia bacterium]